MKKKQLSLLIVLVLLISTICIGCTDKKDDSTKTDATTISTTSEATTEDKTTEATSDECSVNIVKSNSWQNGDKFSAQFDGTINNKGSQTSDWEITFNIPEGATIDSSWNGVYTINGDKLTIVAADYNKQIVANGSTTFGFILTSSEQEYEVEDISITIDGVQSNSNNDTSITTEATTQTTEETDDNNVEEAQTSNEKNTPVSLHGELSVKGVNIVDKNGDKFQLKGVSTHGINWFPEYVNEAGFKTLRDEWKVNTIRLAMYTVDYNGYTSDGNQEELKTLVNDGVEYATNLGMYVIIDWHILNDNNPQTNKEDAIAFFTEMSEKYANYDNVIYEICNEPNGNTKWSDIKAYANEVIPIIKANNSNAIIIVGTPNWSQDVDVAAQDPITGYSNIMYAAHFYATTHKDEIRKKVTTAISKGAPIYISECSICDASGNGTIDYDQADQWMTLINDNNLSYTCWNLSNKNESSSLINSSCTKTSGWTDADYSETGKWFKEQMIK